MQRYWVIAPVQSKPLELFEKVWEFDLANDLISIGWSQLGDVSSMSRQELLDLVVAAYPDKPATTAALFRNMLWSFFHEIDAGDYVLARRGRKTLAAVGRLNRHSTLPARTHILLANTRTTISCGLTGRINPATSSSQRLSFR